MCETKLRARLASKIHHFFLHLWILESDLPSAAGNVDPSVRLFFERDSFRFAVVYNGLGGYCRLAARTIARVAITIFSVREATRPDSCLLRAPLERVAPCHSRLDRKSRTGLSRNLRHACRLRTGMTDEGVARTVQVIYFRTFTAGFCLRRTTVCFL